MSLLSRLPAVPFFSVLAAGFVILLASVLAGSLEVTPASKKHVSIIVVQSYLVVRATCWWSSGFAHRRLSNGSIYRSRCAWQPSAQAKSFVSGSTLVPPGATTLSVALISDMLVGKGRSAAGVDGGNIKCEVAVL